MALARAGHILHIKQGGRGIVKRLSHACLNNGGILALLFSIIFILFWIYVIYLKIGDFAEFKREMANQVFPRSISKILAYTLPMLWLTICFLLAFSQTRHLGLLLSLFILTSFTIYVGLALLDVYRFMPCSCSGLFHMKWKGQFYFNLIATAIAAAGFIFTFKDKGRRKSVWMQ